MIKLTLFSGNRIIFINPEKVNAIYVESTITNVYVNEVVYSVNESPETVARLVIEAKHRKMELQAAYIGINSLYIGDEAYQKAERLEREDLPC